MATTSSRNLALSIAVVMAAAASLLAAGCEDSSGNGNAGRVSGDTSDGATGDPGVDTTGLSPVIDHPYVAFGSVTRAVYEGTEVDDHTGEEVAIGVESVPTGKTTTVASVDVAVVEVVDSEDGEVIERTEDYYAQSPDDTVYYFGERVDDIEDGEVVGHHGQWLAGDGDAAAGIFMPPEPQVGDQFEQERAPGVAEDESRVVEGDLTITVPAGTFTDCIKTEDVDPIDDVTEFKYYCRASGSCERSSPPAEPSTSWRLSSRARRATGGDKPAMKVENPAWGMKHVIVATRSPRPRSPARRRRRFRGEVSGCSTRTSRLCCIG